MEVQPILEVLVGKTIEQALIEVLEEEELAALREQQRRFLEIRAAELDESQRLAEREMRMKKEKEERLKEYDQGLRVQQEMEERIAAAVLMQGYMADLLPSVLEGLEEEGFLTDNIRQGFALKRLRLVGVILDFCRCRRVVHALVDEGNHARAQGNRQQSRCPCRYIIEVGVGGIKDNVFVGF